MMHAQCMQDNVQHTVHYNAQNTTYMMLNIMQHAVHYFAAPTASCTI
jgi:hypothetical protein